MTLAVSVVYRLVIAVYGRRPPADEEWDGYVALLRREGPGVQHLVVTDGGGPTAPQRERLRAQLSDREAEPVAVVTTSAALLVAVSIASLFNSHVSAFPSGSGLADALSRLQVPLSRFDQVESMVAALQRQVCRGAP